MVKASSTGRKNHLEGDTCIHMDFNVCSLQKPANTAPETLSGIPENFDFVQPHEAAEIRQVTFRNDKAHGWVSPAEEVLMTAIEPEHSPCLKERKWDLPHF